MRLFRGLLLTGLGTLTTLMVGITPAVAQVADPAIAGTAINTPTAMRSESEPLLPVVAVSATAATPTTVLSTVTAAEPAPGSPEAFQTWHFATATLEPFQVQPEQTQGESASVALLSFQPVASQSVVPPTPAPPRLAPTARAVKRGGRFQLEITPRLLALAPVRTTPDTALPGARSTAASQLLASSQAALEATALGYVSPAQTTGYQGVPAPPVSALINTMRYPLGRMVPVTSGFGWRTHPLSGNRSFHAGIDLGADYGSPIFAVVAGQVVAVGNGGGYGLRIIVQNGQLQTVYAHLSRAYVAPGMVIQQGQSIGAVGSSGYAMGPHLHLELRVFTVKGWQSIDFESQLAVSQRQVGIASLPQTNSGVTLRVSLLENAHSVTLTTSTPALILDTQNRPFASIQAGQSFITVLTANGIQMGGGQMPPVFFLQPTAKGVVAVGDRWYRDRVLVVARPGGLTVVNWVDLEAYLYSVVGAEAYPSWGQEALKAQAVAARSYALRFRLQPASELYDIGSDTRYQAYKGIVSEYNTTAQAVEATRGQVLLDRLGAVLLAEYAATQDLTDAAHGGFGMSQWGAADLAQKGYNYLQILGFYYRSASLTLLGQR